MLLRRTDPSPPQHTRAPLQAAGADSYEETIERLTKRKEVVGVLVLSLEGKIIRSTVADSVKVLYSTQLSQLAATARETVQKLDAQVRMHAVLRLSCAYLQGTDLCRTSSRSCGSGQRSTRLCLHQVRRSYRCGANRSPPKTQKRTIFSSSFKTPKQTRFCCPVVE